MKWWAKSILIFVVLLLLVGGWFLFSSDTKIPEDTLALLPSRLTVLSETLTLQSSPGIGFDTVTNDVEVFAGATIRTNATGRGLIEAPDESITIIDENTELTLTDTSAGQTTLALHTGNLWSRIEKTLEHGEFYEIETQHAVAAVRGTEFGTLTSNATTTLVITDGVVTTIPKDPITGARLPGDATTTPAGHKVTIDSRARVKIDLLTESDRTSLWFQFNNSDVDKIPLLPTPTPPVPVALPSVQIPPQALTLIRVNPVEVLFRENDNVVLTGSGFTEAVDVFVGTQRISEYFVTQDTTLYFNARDIDGIGTFDVSVVNTIGARASLPRSLTILQPPPAEIPTDREPTKPTSSEPVGTVVFPQGQ